MAYEAYADSEYYLLEHKGSVIPSEELEQALKTASRNIDTLTFNRIVGRGFSNLTPFQQSVIKESCCLLADFYYENADMIECVLQQYSINGVSMSFGNSWNVKVQNGVAIKHSTYCLLCQSGLCSRRLGGFY